MQLPDIDTQRARFLFAPHDSAHSRLLLNWYYQDEANRPVFKTGQEWELQVALKPPVGLNNRNGFDYARWLFRHGIDATGTVRHARLIQQPFIPGWNQIHVYRERIRDWLDRQFQTQPARGLVKALTIGDKSDIPNEHWQLLQASGAAHLLAISGLHIGIMAGIGYYLGLFIFFLWHPVYIKRPHVQSICAFSAALLYALMAGFSIPTIRALLMLSVYLLVVYRKRSIYSWDIYATALLLILLFDPLSVLDMGFWLSFGAVFILLTAFRGRTQSNRWVTWLRAQWVILIGLLPLSVLWFGSIKGFAPLLNLILIPFMTLLLMPLILLMLGLYALFSVTPTWLITAIELCIDVFYRMMQDISQWHWLEWAITQHDWLSWLCLLLFSCLLLIPAVIPHRWLAGLLLLPTMIPTSDDVPKGTVDITVFDVGQGLSILLQTQHHSLLYDTGAASPSGFNMADAVIIPSLKKRGIHSIDKMVLSHADNDHAGAYRYLLKDIAVQQTLAGYAEHSPCLSGHRWLWDGVLFEFLSPYNVDPYLGNNSSCVLKVNTSQYSFLITGDIEHPVEYRLLQQAQQQLAADLMLMPHHGSKTSSGPAFIDAVNPRVAINSSAYANRFGHPADTVKSRYRQRHIPILDTQELGMISIHMGADIHINCYLEDYPRLWHVAERSPQKSPHKCGLLTNVLNSD